MMFPLDDVAPSGASVSTGSAACCSLDRVTGARTPHLDQGAEGPPPGRGRGAAHRQLRLDVGGQLLLLGQVPGGRDNEGAR